MQISPFTKQEIKFFKELNKNKIPFIIVGLASAALQGAPIVTNDIDIWFSNIGDHKLQSTIKKCGAIYIPPIGLNPPSIAGKGFELIDIVTHVHGVKSFNFEYKNCIRIKIAGITLKALPLERIIKSKQHLQRQKDLSVIPALRDTLIALKTKKRI